MMRKKLPYLIEGLDCSGKKTVAMLVKKKLEYDLNIPVKLVVGSFVKSPIGTLDRIISNPNWLSKNIKITKFLKRIIYVIAPVVDFYFYTHPKKYFAIKISSHLRARAKALVDKDFLMIKYFKLLKRSSIKYQGATLLSTLFEMRVLRHQIDFKLGKTKKDETRRFYNSNKQLFQKWESALTDLMSQEINSVIIIENNSQELEVIANKIIDHIKEIYDL